MKKGHIRKGARKAAGAAKKAAKKTGAAAKKAGVKTIETSVKAARLFRINLANTLTLLNGVAGFLSIILSANGYFELASLLILAGVIFDWLDGKAARYFSEVTPLGKELDSLSDLVTFGVAPAALVSFIAPSLLSYVAGSLFVLSAALRLGRFNVQELKGVFFGLPTTSNGILIPILVFLDVALVVYPWYLLIMAFLMNSPLRMKKVL